MSVINRGGAIGEVEEACRGLQEAAVRDGAVAQQAWYEGWKKVAERVEALGRIGRRRSPGGCRRLRENGALRRSGYFFRPLAGPGKNIFVLRGRDGGPAIPWNIAGEEKPPAGPSPAEAAHISL